MKLTELFRRLSYGELSNLALSGEGSGTIISARQPQIIQYTNEALLRLFTRFNLRENDLIIEQFEHITRYPLHAKFAQSVAAGAGSSAEPYPYIVDLLSESPFTGDVIKILEVFDDNLRTLPLNDAGNVASLFTPQPDVLQVPHPRDGVPISVRYQARHPVLLTEMPEGEELLDQEIDLPFHLEGALQLLIGSYVYGHMNGAENNAQSQVYRADADGICLEIENKDLLNQSSVDSHYKFQMRGFR